MNLEILISIDGEQLPLNEELHATVSSIVNSYIKHKISGVKVKEKKVKVPRDPFAPKRKTKRSLTQEEETNIIYEARKYPHLTIGKIIKQVALVVPRGYGSLYKVIKEAQARGELTITKYEPKNMRSLQEQQQ